MLVGGEPLPRVLVYIPDLVEVAITDTQGRFALEKLGELSSSVTLKVRSSLLAKGGFDIPVNIGSLIQVRATSKINHNPYNCAESDKIEDLYLVAKYLTSLHVRARSEFKLLLPALTSGNSKRDTGRAYGRVLYHSRLFLDLCALLPDRPLACKKSVASCQTLDLKTIIRRLHFSAKQMRLELHLFNRQIRKMQLRTPEKSLAVIKQIRSRSARLESLIRKLPRSSARCG